MKRTLLTLLLSFALLLTACQKGNVNEKAGESGVLREADTEKRAEPTERQMTEPESPLSREIEVIKAEESDTAEETPKSDYDSVVRTSMAETEATFPEEKKITEFSYQAYGQDPLASYGVFAKSLIEGNFLKTQLELIGDLDRMIEVLEDMANNIPAAPDSYGSSVYQSLTCPDDGIKVISQDDYLHARRERYDGNFFEDRVLLLVMVFTPYSGYTGGIAEIARKGSDLEIILTEISETSFMDAAIDRYYYCLEIPKEMLEGCEQVTVWNEVYYMDSGRGGGSRTDSFSLKELMANQFGAY